jgi:hypothetical protein
LHYSEWHNLKLTVYFWTGSVVQVGKSLPSKCKALSSNSDTTKKHYFWSFPFNTFGLQLTTGKTMESCGGKEGEGKMTQTLYAPMNK